MSSEQQPIIEDEPLKVLGLFHRREAITISFDQQKFLRLYDSLCCTICRQLFNNPVYLRCSHRFCKQCIEKYIRFNEKKSCPNCRGDLNTKRDLRTDYSITTLIKYAYGDRQKFIEDMTQIENAQVINLQRSNSKSSAVVRSKPLIQQEPKSVRKKVKVSEVINLDDMGEQRSEQKPKKRKSVSKSFDSNKAIEQLRTEQIRNQIHENYYIPKQYSRSFQQHQSMIKTQSYKQKMERQRIVQQGEDPSRSFESQTIKIKRKRGRKKQIPIIQVKSQSSQQNAQIGLGQGPIDFEQKIQPIEPTYPTQPVAKRQYHRTNSYTKQKTTIKMVDENNEPRFDLFQRERKLLKDQFGDGYMLALMKLPVLDFLVEIKLQKHPHCFLTPPISCKSIRLSSKAKLHHVFVLMSKLLNLPIKNITLSANSSKIVPLSYALYRDTTIAQINQDLWKSSTDVQVFDMKEILSTLEDIKGDINKEQELRETTNKIKLFEGIEFEKEQRSSQPRKRGRGRSKKYQDKENTTQDSRDEFKRIFYYKIVSD